MDVKYLRIIAVVIIIILIAMAMGLPVSTSQAAQKTTQQTTTQQTTTQQPEVRQEEVHAEPAVIVPPEEPTWTLTNAVGGLGTAAFDYKCPEGQYINNINISAGWGVDRIGAKCSGGNVSSEYGGRGGTPSSISLPYGATSMVVHANDTYIGNVTPGDYYNTSGLLPTGGLNRGQYQGIAHTLSCPPGKKIAGIYGSNSAYLNKLGFHCLKL